MFLQVLPLKLKDSSTILSSFDITDMFLMLPFVSFRCTHPSIIKLPHLTWTMFCSYLFHKQLFMQKPILLSWYLYISFENLISSIIFHSPLNTPWHPRVYPADNLFTQPTCSGTYLSIIILAFPTYIYLLKPFLLHQLLVLSLLVWVMQMKMRSEGEKPLEL